MMFLYERRNPAKPITMVLWSNKVGWLVPRSYEYVNELESRNIFVASKVENKRAEWQDGNIGKDADLRPAASQVAFFQCNRVMDRSGAMLDSASPSQACAGYLGIGMGERARTALLCLILCHHTITSEPELAFAMHEIGSLHGITKTPYSG